MYLLKKSVQFKIRSYMAVAGCIQPKDLYDNPIVPIHSFSGKSGFSLDRLPIPKAKVRSPSQQLHAGNFSPLSKTEIP